MEILGPLELGPRGDLFLFNAAPADLDLHRGRMRRVRDRLSAVHTRANPDVLFFSGLNMMGLGVLGEYLGRVFIEVKQRPLYLIDDLIGFEDDPAGVDRKPIVRNERGDR